MANAIIYTKQNADGERQNMTYTYSSNEFTPNTTSAITGKIKSITFYHRLQYTGTSNPEWTGNVSIVAADGTSYTGTNSTYTIIKNGGTMVTLTIPEANCPPASVINSGNFSIKRTTVECSKNVYVPETATLTLTINYEGIVPYIHNGTKWIESTPYIHNGTKYV